MKHLDPTQTNETTAYKDSWNTRNNTHQNFSVDMAGPNMFTPSHQNGTNLSSAEDINYMFNQQALINFAQ